MQDNYVGDIGDYGKYGLLRIICAESLSLSVNWYKVVAQTNHKQDDGKYINFLTNPKLYRDYDPTLFDSLLRIVCTHNDRRIERIEQEDLFPAKYYSAEVNANRLVWHKNALSHTEGTEVVFLDPDNGLETYNMFCRNKATKKHVKWSELSDYYTRGQNVVLYQHRPQMTKKEQCIDNVIRFQKEYLKADCVKLLEFPKYTNRFFFAFIHNEHKDIFERICHLATQQWGKNGFCREIIV